MSVASMTSVTGFINLTSPVISTAKWSENKKKYNFMIFNALNRIFVKDDF